MEEIAAAPTNRGQGTEAVIVCSRADLGKGKEALWAIDHPNFYKTLNRILRLTRSKVPRKSNSDRVSSALVLGGMFKPKGT
jgi:hypothetical protein